MKRNSNEMFTLCERFIRNTVPNAARCAYDAQFVGVRQIARAAGVTEQTVFRWVRDEQKPDSAHLQLLRLHAFGLVLPESQWKFFRFRGDALWFNEAYYLTATDLRRQFILK